MIEVHRTAVDDLFPWPIADLQQEGTVLLGETNLGYGLESQDLPLG
jgi:hypothetical protein